MISEQEAIAALPESGFIRDYVLAMRAATDANVAYHIPCAFAVLAQTAPHDLGFPKGMNHAWTNIYGLLVGSTTHSRKTTAIDAPRILLNESGSLAVADQPGSQEALVENLIASPRQLILYEEFGAFLAATTAGSYLHSLRTTYTNIYDGSPLSCATQRRKREKASTRVERPRLSIIAGINLDYLESYTIENDWTGGFLARFFTICAERERTFDIQPTSVAAKAALLSRIIALKDTCDGYSGLDAGPMPCCLGLDAQASELWIEWLHGTRIQAEGAAKEIRGGLERAQTMAFKLATLLAWDDGCIQPGGDPWHVTCAQLLPALKMTNLHVKSVLEIGARLAPNQDSRDKQRVLEYIKSINRPVPIGEISKQTRVMGLMRRLKEILGTLETEKQVTRVTEIGKGDFYYATPLSDTGDDSNVVSLFKAAPPLVDDGENSMGDGPENSAVSDMPLNINDGEQSGPSIISTLPSLIAD